MVELRHEDPSSFQNFMRMSPAMFDELLNRLTPRLTRPSTNYRANLEAGLKLAVTLRHLASGTKYRDMAYGWRVPHNTISKVVREVCQSVSLKKDGANSPMNECRDGNSPTPLGPSMASMSHENSPKTGSEYYNYKGFFSIILLAMVSSDYKFLWADVSGNGSPLDAQMFNHRAEGKP
ncbi:uncharacterized protein LOC143025993 [Oratosquilla oratoria]|uniref:uncharacterized protein LOC143025993 n=1 Tax=Oratosquilla oratoria TaxID=337810 RepID=UPI003F75CBE2